ncbi:hypothetical protein FOMG_17722 [Fusarium oxysporum f. sp. melonis 26406]|uniref:Uncharacterized protein n=1 Tax=Fusarium oxysporum f. sp. melonis 26406 TaxID=1089452 RepID=W9ZX29_FUSOX|nr:hypothetical protein FOMG_17722 [Fusarium oxysporum f. sp. melonis 26406]
MRCSRWSTQYLIPPILYGAVPAVKHERSRHARALTLISSRSPFPLCPDQNKGSRDRLFAALEIGGPFLRPSRSIASRDDLGKLELKRCLKILHACGLLTDLSATLASINIIYGFIDMIFKNSTGNTLDTPHNP